jgi:hypothetical protein
MICPTHKTSMKPLFTSHYCPECEKRPVPVRATGFICKYQDRKYKDYYLRTEEKMRELLRDFRHLKLQTFRVQVYGPVWYETKNNGAEIGYTLVNSDEEGKQEEARGGRAVLILEEVFLSPPGAPSP